MKTIDSIIVEGDHVRLVHRAEDVRAEELFGVVLGASVESVSLEDLRELRVGLDEVIRDLEENAWLKR